MKNKPENNKKSTSQTSRDADKTATESNASRSKQPRSASFKDFMRSAWDTSTAKTDLPCDNEPAQRRRHDLKQQFTDDVLIIPAGSYKQRSNDTDYRFRPHSAFVYYTGLGIDYEPQAVLVINTSNSNKQSDTKLFIPTPANSQSEEYYGNPRYGEFWIGPRPTLEEFETKTAIPTSDISTFKDYLSHCDGQKIRIIAEADPDITSYVKEQRTSQNIPVEAATEKDKEFEIATSQARLIKDETEIEHTKDAIFSTIKGFENVVKSFKKVLDSNHGERVVEGEFFSAARENGNGLGYDTIAATGNNATILHWIQNTGAANKGDLLLLDAGVEDDTLYTADITRTLPLSGKFTSTQKKVYDAVLEAANEAFKLAIVGNKFSDVHDAAMKVLTHKLESWDILPVSAQESLKPENQQHRRWMPHGTSHHLGLDVHDCAHARAEFYINGTIKPGMIFTIEPGLYFKQEDLTIPEELRGIGVRIEDDILITAEGPVNLSKDLPRTTKEIEQWISSAQEDNKK